MDLQEFFTNLSYGPLSKTSTGDDGSGSVPEAHHAKLVTYTNKALKLLYGRFKLLEKELALRLITDQHNYPFLKIHADQDPTVAVKFIEDTAENPFQEDVLKVLRLYDHFGCPQSLNDRGVPGGPSTRDHKSLLVPAAKTRDYLYVVYQANHPKLVADPPVEVVQQIILPDFLYAALEHHVAYQVFSPSTNPELAAKGIENFQAFTEICREAEEKDLANTSEANTHTKLEDRGFV